MTTPVELRAAVEGRPGWQVDGEGAAVYQPSGAAMVVRVRALARPVDRRRENFHAALVRGDRPTHAATFYSADEAVRWAEATR